MTAMPDPATALLLELTRQGIELQAHGDRLRYRPRSRMTPELAERTKAHKPELLTLLRGDRPPQLPQDGQNRSTVAMTSPVGTVGRPNAPTGRKPCDPPRELSLVERVKTGYVNPGWTPEAWADRLQQLADRCEAMRPEVAAQYRTWARNVLENEKRLA